MYIKKMFKPFLAVAMMICLIISQSDTIFAASNSSITIQQLDTIFNGVESITAQLKELGLSETDISELFHLSPREAEFYTRTTPQSIPYTGAFAKEPTDEAGLSLFSGYNGNAPDSDAVQKERIENIYGVALQYFKSNYYEGSSQNGEDFGKYLTYLYLSHYIDGPGRAPTQNDLPYIISQSDINAYDTFIGSAKISSLTSELANLGSAIYSDVEYVKSLNAINTVDTNIRQSIGDIATLGLDIDSTKSVCSSITPLVNSFLVEHHATASDEDELTQETFDYVSSRLYALNFYENYDKNVIDTITSILISTLISAVCNSVELLGLCVSVIPLFVYSFTGLIQAAVLVNLQYSFSGRYAIRTDIYLNNY